MPGYREIELKLPTGYTPEVLRDIIGKELHLKKFRFEILNQGLDARKKNNIYWQTRVAVFSTEIKQGNPPVAQALKIPWKKRNRKVLVTGSGPAGFFAAYVLQRAGFSTTLIDRGAEVGKRERGILEFEKTGLFNQVSNYAFGEGGAGTFSDGKLTSRSKHITLEKKFILDSYVKAGAPPEISYLTHPHVGSDNLKIVVKNLRESYIGMGGTMLFETMLEDLITDGGHVKEAVTGKGNLEADCFIMAPGHSAFETYRVLMRRGVAFMPKNFALGFRAEHPQEIINRAQWGVPRLPGVKAAEYRLTSNREGRLPVFTFCMCPGGMVVPATAYANTNVVNGMSHYRRDGQFANAACVAGIHPDRLAGQSVDAASALDLLQQLEERFFEYSQGYKAPCCTISDFLQRKQTSMIPSSSFPLGLLPAPLWKMVPEAVSESIAEGLREFSHKLKGYESGILMGLESKTSSPIRALRDQDGKCVGFDNLWIAGEGSGYAGGIVSSAADGIRIAMTLAGA